MTVYGAVILNWCLFRQTVIFHLLQSQQPQLALFFGGNFELILTSGVTGIGFFLETGAYSAVKDLTLI